MRFAATSDERQHISIAIPHARATRSCRLRLPNRSVHCRERSFGTGANLCVAYSDLSRIRITTEQLNNAAHVHDDCVIAARLLARLGDRHPMPRNRDACVCAQGQSTVDLSVFDRRAPDRGQRLQREPALRRGQRFRSVPGTGQRERRIDSTARQIENLASAGRARRCVSARRPGVALRRFFTR